MQPKAEIIWGRLTVGTLINSNSKAIEFYLKGKYDLIDMSVQMIEMLTFCCACQFISLVLFKHYFLLCLFISFLLCSLSILINVSYH